MLPIIFHMVCTGLSPVSPVSLCSDGMLFISNERVLIPKVGFLLNRGMCMFFHWESVVLHNI